MSSANQNAGCGPDVSKNLEEAWVPVQPEGTGKKGGGGGGAQTVPEGPTSAWGGHRWSLRGQALKLRYDDQNELDREDLEGT